MTHDIFMTKLTFQFNNCNYEMPGMVAQWQIAGLAFQTRSGSSSILARYIFFHEWSTLAYLLTHVVTVPQLSSDHRTGQ